MVRGVADGVNVAKYISGTQSGLGVCKVGYETSKSSTSQIASRFGQQIFEGVIAVTLLQTARLWTVRLVTAASTARLPLGHGQLTLNPCEAVVYCSVVLP